MGGPSRVPANRRGKRRLNVSPKRIRAGGTFGAGLEPNVRQRKTLPYWIGMFKYKGSEIKVFGIEVPNEKHGTKVGTKVVDGKTLHLYRTTRDQEHLYGFNDVFNTTPRTRERKPGK